jgi:hypothetical protein
MSYTFNLSGRRVIGGVRALWFINPRRRLAVGGGARLSLSSPLWSHRRAALRNILGGASREARGFESHRSRSVRNISTARPNNGMHPTADTKDFIFLLWRGAAGDAGR